jgi:hypothetical protein
MKLGYNDLKELVKEALVEILQEGLGNLLLSDTRINRDVADDQGDEEIEDTISTAKQNQTAKQVSTPFTKSTQTTHKQHKKNESQNRSQQTLTSMYENKTLHKMGEQLSKQKTQTEKNNLIGKNTIKSITDDPLMASIFADTAKTTLQEQIKAESSNIGIQLGHDRATQIAAENDPMDLFDENVSANWENLAFSPTISTKK